MILKTMFAIRSLARSAQVSCMMAEEKRLRRPIDFEDSFSKYAQSYFHGDLKSQESGEQMRNKDHPLYCRWKEMRKRCYKPYHKNYSSYGGKGITICEEWNDFWQFVADMGPHPSKKHTVDRIDNSKGYSKSNCRWATQKQQTDNRRIAHECYKGHPWTKESTIWTHNGVNDTRRCKICYEAKDPRK